MKRAANNPTAAVAAMLMLGMVGMTGIANRAFGAQEASPANPAAARTQAVYLDYREAENGLMRWAVSVRAGEVSFKKEPDFKPGKVWRARLEFGSDTNEALPFAWDTAAGKFYLDWNRNLDLTDDPNGVFNATAKPRSAAYQDFQGVRLTLNTASGPYPLLVNLNLSYNNKLRASASVRSFYAGKVTLANREWQIGVIAKPHDLPVSLPGAPLLLRPWADRNKPFTVESDVLDTFTCRTNLFFQDQAYRVEGQRLWENNQTRYRVQLTEQAVSLGDLKFTGQFIRRAILKDGPWTVVLDEPVGTVKVPLGAYSSYDVQIQKGDVGAGLDAWPGNQDISKLIVVTGSRAATIVAGGPLTNAVVVNRRGNNLVFNYRLLGAGGATYRLLQQDRSNPPRFAVYKGDKKLASGKFEFG